MALDLSKLIYERFWIPLLSYGNLTITKQSSPEPLSGKTLVFTITKTLNVTPYHSSILNTSFPILIINSSNEKNFQNYEFPFKIIYNNTATLNIPPVIGYGNQVPMSVSINQFYLDNLKYCYL